MSAKLTAHEKVNERRSAHWLRRLVLADWGLLSGQSLGDCVGALNGQRRFAGSPRLDGAGGHAELVSSRGSGAAGLARDQLTAIGNSLVPQVAHVWLKAIAESL